MRSSDFWDAVDQSVRLGKEHSALQKIAEDDQFAGPIIRVDGQPVVHFASCSYLGLELDPRLKQGAIDAVQRWGTQFASSRAYISAPPYRELEALLGELFEAPAVVAPTTTLAHLSALPVIVDERDALLLDQRVHTSVHMAANHARLAGVKVELLRHARLDQLAERVAVLSRTHRNVWYALDGVFSMQGELAPVDALMEFLERFEQLHLYFDDAHGMSWTGRHGKGTVLGRVALHPRMIVATSLTKAFAAVGGALLIGDAERRRKVVDIGPSLMFSGPIPPPMLGAAIASARIHLSEELPLRQAALHERIRFCNQRLTELGLPLMAPHQIVPIRFVAVGSPRATFSAVRRLMRAGFFVNAAAFPAVPEAKSGIRFTLTCHHSLQDIQRLADALAEAILAALEEEGLALEDARAALEGKNVWAGAAKATPELRLERSASIQAIDAAEWDRLLGGNGAFTWEGLRSLEQVFRENEAPEENSTFRYYVVRDGQGRPVLATFFSASLWKDDMLAPEHVSRRIEQRRAAERYYLTSRGLMMGSLLTEGQHLYLDRSADWRGAMRLLLEEVDAERERLGATSLMIRDVPEDDVELDAFMREQGFVRFPMPQSSVLELDFENDAQWLESLSKSSRRHQRNNVLPWEGAYTVEVLRRGGRAVSEMELEHLHRLYRNVREHSFEINTFELPRKLFPTLLSSDAWEVLTLTLKPEHGGEPGGAPVAMAASVVGPRTAGGGPEHYSVMLAGLDYRYVRSHASYRQLLLQSMRRARELSATRLMLGLGTVGEKHCFGAKASRPFGYVQSSDQYPSAILLHLMEEPIRDSSSPRLPSS